MPSIVRLTGFAYNVGDLPRATPRPLNPQDFDPNAPVDVEGTRYTQGGTTVVEILDPGLGHEWPGWDIMAIAVELFGR